MALATPLRRLLPVLAAPATVSDPAGPSSLTPRHALSLRHGRLRSSLALSPSPDPRSSRSLTASAAAGGRPTVLVTEKLGPAGLDLLRSFANVDCSYELTAEELRAKVSLVDALVVRSGTRVTREVFEAARGRLRVVGRAGVGIDNVDLQAATEAGCLVVNAPTANTVAAAEHAVALLTAMARNVAQADASLKAGKWQRSKYIGVTLVGKTLAVMGFGKVGSEVARRAKGLGMDIIAHDPYAPVDRARAIGVDLVSFDEAISTADFISLHMPLTPSTEKLFNDETFEKMKKGVRIINVARGGVVDEEALLRALDNGTVAQAALDVFTEEPPPRDSKLVQHENVTVTPHLGASTTEAQEGVALEIAEAVIGALRGDLAATAVNAPMVPAEVLSELSPYVILAEKLGRLVVQLVAGGIGDRCGSCEAAPAALHCRSCPGSGGAFLCTACDARPGHARLGHERVWMCEVCELAPAAVTCKADAAVLCAACDADIHDANPLARRHTRVPVAPIGSEAAAAAVEAMLFGTGEPAASEADELPQNHQQQHQHQHHQEHSLNLNVEAKDMKLDYLFSDLDPYLSVEIPRFQHADSVVPSGVGAGNGGAVELDFTCGIGVKPSSYSSYTATSLAHSGSSSEVGVVPEAFCGAGGGSFELDFTRPKPQAYIPYTATPQSHSMSSVDVEVVPERGDMAATARPVPLMGESREARLMRYREKRKNRRFEKTIRYASRKAYAETRPRIKGRFAKRADNDGDADDAEAEAAVPTSYVLDFGYGVVPSF